MSEEKQNVVEKAVETVKETAEKVVEKTVDVAKDTVDVVKETTEDVVDAVKAPARSKKATWWNRIWSAIVGAVLAVAAMFGITEPQIKEQKAKVEEVTKLAGEALELAKAGKIEDAKAALELAVESGKELKEQAKKDVESVKEKAKEAKAEDIASEAVKGAKESLVKDAKTEVKQ
jgi:ElaB/YqjD/DUF883 family membrane-anchored ribosome-binding protein